MSHFTVLVFGPETTSELHDALDPFNEQTEVRPYTKEVSKFTFERGKKLAQEAGATGRNISPERIAKALFDTWGEEFIVRDGKLMETATYNPDGHWDWWVLGGRWRGFFKVKPDVEYDPTFHLGEPGTGERLAILDGKGAHHDYQTLRMADRAAIGDIDFDDARERAMKTGRKSFSRWRDCFSKHPRPTGWKEVRDKLGHSSRSQYGEQPAIKAFKAQRDKDNFWMGCPVDTFGFDEEAYVQSCANGIYVPYAMVIDGEWIGQESDSFTSDINDPQERMWADKVHHLFNTLPAETIVSLVDCHS